MRRRDGGPEELETTTEASAEEDEPEVLTMTTETSYEEAEEKTLPSERLQMRRRRCVYGLRVFMTTPASSSE